LGKYYTHNVDIFREIHAKLYPWIAIFREDLFLDK